MLSLTRSKQILLEGFVIQNSPAWTIHPLLCENITLRSVTARNPWYGQNTDALAAYFAAFLRGAFFAAGFRPDLAPPFFDPAFSARSATASASVMLSGVPPSGIVALVFWCLTYGP